MVGGPAGRRPVVTAGELPPVGAHRAAVGGDVPVESVGALGEFVGGVGVGDRRGAVDRVVRRHQARHVRVLDEVAELGGVVVAQIGVVDVRADAGAVVLDVVQRVVLGGGGDLQIARLRGAVRVVALVSVDELPGHLPDEVRVLAEGLVGAAPARVAVEVDGGRPVGEGTVVVGGGAEVVLPGAEERLVEEAADLVGDRGALLVHQVLVPGHGRGEVGREAGGVDPALHPAVVLVGAELVDPVLALAPVRVLLDAQPGDGRAAVRAELLHLLLEGHPGHQVRGALLEGVVGVQVDRGGRRLGAGDLVARRMAAGRLRARCLGRRCTAVSRAESCRARHRADRGESRAPAAVACPSCLRCHGASSIVIEQGSCELTSRFGASPQ